jgi:hypothetical protein
VHYCLAALRKISSTPAKQLGAGLGWGTNKKATWYFAFFYPPSLLLLLFLHAFAHVLCPNPSLLVLAPDPEGKPREDKS